MRKALWFVVNDPIYKDENRPNQIAGAGPKLTLDEMEEKMQTALLDILQEAQGATWRSGPKPTVTSGQADTTKLRIMEVAWKG